MLTQDFYYFYKHAGPKDRFEALSEELLEELTKVRSQEDREMMIKSLIHTILDMYCECGAVKSKEHECEK